MEIRATDMDEKSDMRRDAIEKVRFLSNNKGYRILKLYRYSRRRSLQENERIFRSALFS